MMRCDLCWYPVVGYVVYCTDYSVYVAVMVDVEACGVYGVWSVGTECMYAGAGKAVDAYAAVDVGVTGCWAAAVADAELGLLICGDA